MCLSTAAADYAYVAFLLDAVVRFKQAVPEDPIFEPKRRSAPLAPSAARSPGPPALLKTISVAQQERIANCRARVSLISPHLPLHPC